MMKKVFSKILQRFARLYISKNKPYIIGITGSIGKTSSRMIISRVLETMLPESIISTSSKNFNSDIGLALAILQIQSFTPSVFGSIRALFLALSHLVSGKAPDVLILEYGIDGPGDMDELLGICVPHVAIFTGLDKVHSSAFDSPDDILVEKAKLLYGATELVLYPYHASYMKEVIEQVEVDVLSYALESGSADADIGFEQYSLEEDSGGRILSNFAIDQGIDTVLSMQTNAVSEISAGYTSIGVELAMILGNRLGVRLDLSNQVEFEMQSGRWSMFKGKYDSIIIDSTYNAAPLSMKHAIKQTIQLRNTLYSDYQLVYCLGDMNELGDFSQQEHQQLAGFISQSADQIFLLGTQTIYTYDELMKVGFSPSRVQHFSSSKALGEALAQYLESHDGKHLVLAKASQGGLYMEEAIHLVLNEEDGAHLPRQDSFRQKKKKNFFGI